MKPKIMAELYCPRACPTSASSDAQERLISHFGGCTEVYGAGSWVHPDSRDIVREDVLILRVAIPENEADILHSIAEQYKVESGEHTVMYSIGTEVLFI